MLLRPNEIRVNMRPAVLTALLICTLVQQSHTNAERTHYKSRKDRCDDGELPIPQLLEVLEQPGFAAELHHLAIAVAKDSVMNNWTLSAVRHVTRRRKGLPHIIEVPAFRLLS